MKTFNVKTYFDFLLSLTYLNVKYTYLECLLVKKHSKLNLGLKRSFHDHFRITYAKLNMESFGQNLDFWGRHPLPEMDEIRLKNFIKNVQINSKWLNTNNLDLYTKLSQIFYHKSFQTLKRSVKIICSWFRIFFEINVFCLYSSLFEEMGCRHQKSKILVNIDINDIIFCHLLILYN